MKWYGLTDIGKVRKNNEDAFYLPKEGESFFILADGMGGHLGGERASGLAVASISDTLGKGEETSPKRRIRKALVTANAMIYSESLSEKDYRGMGTTVSLLFFEGDLVYFANVGDSRIYVLSNGELIQITRDDSFVNYLLDVGEITEEEALNHPRKNVLTKALGTTKQLEFEVASRPCKRADRYLMCSDGLTSMVEPERIRELLVGHSPKESAELLKTEALHAGGRDNVTMIIIDLE